MMAPSVLLTGATGFIGGATLARLLDSRPDCRVFLLARDRGSEAAADRLQRSLERFVEPERAKTLLRSCEIIRGDLTNAASLSSHQLDDVTHVLHLASNTNLRSVGSVRHTNVLGSLTLAHRMRRVPGLQRFLVCVHRWRRANAERQKLRRSKDRKNAIRGLTAGAKAANRRRNEHGPSPE